MSLASRVYHFLNSSSAHGRTASLDQSDPQISAKPGYVVEEVNRSDTQSIISSRGGATMAAVEEIEEMEGRPPYVHVSD